MRLAILGDEVAAVDFGVDLGGRQAGVAEKFLDDAEIGAIAQKMGGEGMAERMRCRRLG